MNKDLGRWLRAAGMVSFAVSMLGLGSGCGAIAAAANPKVAWAVGDPAPMSVVVRRADVAEATSKEVDRLLTATPTNDDSPWLKKTAPAQDDAKKQADAIAQEPMYAQSGARVVKAEVWSRALSQAKDAKVDAPKSAAAEPEPKKDVKDPKAQKTAKKDGKKADTKAGKNTPAPAPEPQTPAAPANKYASLLGAIDKELGEKYGVVMTKKKAIADLKAQIAVEEAALDQKNVSDADKKAHKDKIKELEKSVDAEEGEIKSLQKELIASAKGAAAKASPEVRERFGPTLVNLRQAVDDAGVANGAAAVRYPLAVPTLLDSTKAMVAVFVADIIEEKTGKRPSMQGLQPGVTLDGTDVQITLNGLSQSDMGKISMGELTEETVKRTKKWVGHALGLLGSIASTKEILSFEQDVLDALVDGMKSGGWTPPAAPQIPDATPAQPQQQPKR